MLNQSQCTGTAAEYLVCFDLALRGLHAVPNVFEHCAYDVVADANGRLLKIQVKGLRRMYRNCYQFDMRADGRFGRTKEDRERTYDSVDLFAFVAIDQMKIIWRHATNVNTTTVRFTPLAMAQGDDEALLQLLQEK